MLLATGSRQASSPPLSPALAPMTQVTIDFVARDPWRMVLVEEGPWENVPSNLRRLQERLYACVDAAIDGQFAQLFPESRGARITVLLECHALPREQISSFFESFSSGVLEIPAYKEALQSSAFVSGIDFGINHV